MFYNMVNKEEDKLLTFPKFMKLIEHGMIYDRYKHMDSHLAPQVRGSEQKVRIIIRKLGFVLFYFSQ